MDKFKQKEIKKIRPIKNNWYRCLINYISDPIRNGVGEIFEQTEEDYYKPKIVRNFWNNNYIEYESNGNRNRNLSLVYLNRIKPYLRGIIIDLQNSDTWKIQLTIAINFISSKDAEEECVMYSRSENMKFRSYNDANNTVDELFDSPRLRFQDNLETSMRRSDFIFYSVQLMYCKCHKVNIRRAGSYIDSPD